MPRVITWICSLDLRRLAAWLFGSVVLVGFIGIVTYLVDPENAWLDLDSELSLRWPITETTLALPAVWSAVLFASGAGAWLVVAWLRPSRRVTAAAIVLGSTLALFALDELFIIHERLEYRTGVEWMVLYFPVALITATAVMLLAWELRVHRAIPVLLVGGIVCWAATVPLEALEWRGDEQREYYELLAAPEELLELCGSVLLILAGLRLTQLLAPESVRKQAKAR